MQGKTGEWPCLKPSSPHGIVLVENGPCATDKLKIGLERAQHEWVVFVHQDIYFLERWDRCLTQQPRRLDKPGIADFPGGPAKLRRANWDNSDFPGGLGKLYQRHAASPIPLRERAP